MSRRESDSRGEKAMGVFLDKYFYSKAQEKRLLSYVERIYDKKLQLQGIDVLIDNRNIDEKAQLYYINNPVDSFAFEIDYFSEERGHIVDGWFINDSNKTDDYLLLWIEKARTTEINRLVAEDFENVSVDLISKKHIKAYLDGLGISNAVLKKKALEMRKNKLKRVDFSDDIHLSYSMKGYAEEPINLVIKKKVLDEISTKQYKISKTDINVLK